MPRAALKDLANARGLAGAAAEARAEFGRNGAGKQEESDEDGVELWADWRCSCVRLRGVPAAVRRAVSPCQEPPLTFCTAVRIKLHEWSHCPCPVEEAGRG